MSRTHSCLFISSRMDWGDLFFLATPFFQTTQFLPFVCVADFRQILLFKIAGNYIRYFGMVCVWLVDTFVSDLGTWPPFFRRSWLVGLLLFIYCSIFFFWPVSRGYFPSTLVPAPRPLTAKTPPLLGRKLCCALLRLYPPNPQETVSFFSRSFFDYGMGDWFVVGLALARGKSFLPWGVLSEQLRLQPAFWPSWRHPRKIFLPPLSFDLVGLSSL